MQSFRPMKIRVKTKHKRNRTAKIYTDSHLSSVNLYYTDSAFISNQTQNTKRSQLKQNKNELDKTQSSIHKLNWKNTSVCKSPKPLG